MNTVEIRGTPSYFDGQIGGFLYIDILGKKHASESARSGKDPDT